MQSVVWLMDSVKKLLHVSLTAAKITTSLTMSSVVIHWEIVINANIVPGSALIVLLMFITHPLTSADTRSPIHYVMLPSIALVMITTALRHLQAFQRDV